MRTGDAGAELTALWDTWPTRDHAQITRQGLVGTGLEGASATIAGYVDKVDRDAFLSPRTKYDPAGHFDRPMNVSHVAAFLAGIVLLRNHHNKTFYDLVIAGRATGADSRESLDNAARSLGSLLHGRQDAYAHSNYLDLSEGGQKEFARLLDAGAGSVSANLGKELMLTGYDINAPTPGSPPGDRYPHDKCAVGHGHQGKEKMERARVLAIGDTRHAVLRLRKSLAASLGQVAAERVWTRFASV